MAGHKCVHYSEVPLYTATLNDCFIQLSVLIVGFERQEYTVSETWGADLGLLVCVTVEDVAFPFTLITSSHDGTAQGMHRYYLGCHNQFSHQILLYRNLGLPCEQHPTAVFCSCWKPDPVCICPGHS